MELLVVGRLIQFLYPSANYRCVRRRVLELRRGRITRVRDLRDEPLQESSIAADPDKCRGTVLVYVWDFDKQAERLFYVESMSELRELETAPRELPQLVVAFAKDGMFHSTFAQDDPRVSFCKFFNERSRDLVAVA